MVARRSAALVIVFCSVPLVVSPALLFPPLLRSFFSCAVFAVISSCLDKRFEGGRGGGGYEGFHIMGRNGGTCQYEQWYERFNACVMLLDAQCSRNGLIIFFATLLLCSTCVKD